ncbi:hypothetical protein BKA64DRAFT_633692 [Cadophora sp. MPI-SDFR-AT-0126]|nr:hypothetical protein BKA64DRAFT_633692 [Leotiomycetes sp. MPI-SDFR-AT-0126]
MPRLVLWRKNRFVKKPSPLKNAVLADDPMDVDTQSSKHKPNRRDKEDEASDTNHTPTNGCQSQAQESVLKENEARIPSPRSIRNDTVSIPTSNTVKSSKKRKARHDSDSSINKSTTLLTLTHSSPSSSPSLQSHSHQTTASSSTSLPTSTLPITNSNPAIPNPNHLHTSSPTPATPPKSPKPTLIIKLKVPTWFKTHETPISQSDFKSKSRNTPLPASRATKCPNCGGIHTSTCYSNMDRLDEIAAQLAILGTLSYATRHVIDEVLEQARLTHPPQPQPLLHGSSSSAAAAASDLYGQDINATKSPFNLESNAALKYGLENLLLESHTWVVKARPLMLEAAMREGNLEEGERLRSEVREDGGGVVRAGDAERYFQEVRERYLGGMRG